MITKEELQLIVVGTANEAARQIAVAGGRRLTGSELDAMGQVFATALGLVADRCRTIPPLPQAQRERRPSVWFDAMRTQELPRVSDEDIAKAKK
jgi:hypothetical protein